MDMLHADVVRLRKNYSLLVDPANIKSCFNNKIKYPVLKILPRCGCEFLDFG